MNIFKRLFGGKKQTFEPMRGATSTQSDEQQNATRVRMEEEMLASREKRAADQESKA